MHYYNFNIGDYKTHTAHLTPIEDICYRRMIDYYYLHEKPLPNDIDKLCRVLMLNGCSADVERVLNEYFFLVENEWQSNRINDEIFTYNEKVRKSVEAGKASGRARLERSLNGRSTNGEPTNNQEPITNIKSSSSSSSSDDQNQDEKISENPEKPKPHKKPIDEIPYEQIQEIYNEIMLDNPACMTLTDARKSLIRARWNDKTKTVGVRQNLDYWRKFFTRLSQSDFITGKVLNSNGKAPFVANFDWIFNATNFAKIIEGTYENRR